MRLTSWAKRAFWSSPYGFRIAVLYARYFLGARARARRHIAEQGLEVLTWERLRGFKRSDTLFVLGSGPSVNLMAREKWDIVRQHDSIGFNFWLFHALVPTLYLFEMVEDQEAESIRLFAMAAEKEAARYEHVPKIVCEFQNGLTLFNRLTPQFRRNLLAHYSVPAFIDNDRELAAAIRLLKWAGLFRQYRSLHNLFKHGGSLTAIISLAVKMNYRRIVLCGIDLRSPSYFYEDRALYPDIGGLHSVIPPRGHDVNVPGLFRCAYPIDKVVPELKRQVLDPMGIEIYVENASSALHPAIPLAPDNLWHAREAKAS
jgi:hypothetical protein